MSVRKSSMSVNDVKQALARRAEGQPAQPGQTVRDLLQSEAIKARFSDLLGQKAPAFMSSIINVVNNSPELKAAEPMSVLNAAAIAAVLDLPINPNLGFAYIVPYRRKDGSVIAQFQLGYKGYIQLAMRTGVYRTINACEVYEGEIKAHNRFTGDFEFGPKASDVVVGYMAYFRLNNGFEKYYYMSVEEIKQHAERYSQSFRYGSGPWATDFHSMATKTVLKRLLSRYGILSVEMQTGLQADQALVTQTEDGWGYEYVDNENEIEAVVPSPVGETDIPQLQEDAKPAAQEPQSDSVLKSGKLL